MNRMLMITLGSVLLLAAGAASAQTATSGSESNSTSGAAAQAVNFGNSTTYTSTSRVNNPRQAPTAIAPGLAASAVETCLGSTSGGISGPGFGVSFGTTREDAGCDIRLTARQLYAMGAKGAAVAVMCQHERVARAFAITGTPCPGYPGYIETLPRNSAPARAAAYAPALGYGPSQAAYVATTVPQPATVRSDVFSDSKGRRYQLVDADFRSVGEARRAGVIRSASGEWVRLIK